MKKILTLFVVMFLVGGVALAQAERDPFLWGNFSPDEALEHLPGFLPMYFDGNGFSSKEVKDSIGQAMQHKLGKPGRYSYQDYFNAAVIYATSATPLRETIALGETEVENVKKYAAEAIRLSPNEPYMYLLRGKVLLWKGIEYSPTGDFRLRNKELAQSVLRDFEKVKELNLRLAPYGDMYIVARVLGEEDKAALYGKLANIQEDSRLDKEAKMRRYEALLDMMARHRGLSEQSSKKVTDMIIRHFGKLSSRPD